MCISIRSKSSQETVVIPAHAVRCQASSTQVGDEVTELAPYTAILIDLHHKHGNPLPGASLKDHEAHLAASLAVKTNERVIDRGPDHTLNAIPGFPQNPIKLPPGDDRHQIKPVAGLGSRLGRPQLADKHRILEEPEWANLVAQEGVERVYFDSAQFAAAAHGYQSIASHGCQRQRRPRIGGRIGPP